MFRELDTVGKRDKREKKGKKKSKEHNCDDEDWNDAEIQPLRLKDKKKKEKDSTKGA